MDTLVKELATYGIFGKKLSEVPTNTIDAVMESSYGEIRDVDAIEELKTKVITANLGKDYKAEYKEGISLTLPSELHPQSDYFLRLKTSEWRKYVMRNFPTQLDDYFWMTSEILQEPRGIPRDEFAIRFPKLTSKNISDRLRRLLAAGLIACEMINEHKTYFYIWDSKKVSSMDEEQNVEEVTSAKEFKLTKSVYDIVGKRKVFVLSDLRERINKKCAAARSRSDKEVSLELEKNGYKVIEIDSKHMPTEYVIFEEDISPDDAKVAAETRAGMKLILSGFRRRIWREIVATPDEAHYDNGFVYLFSERIRIFYEYIMNEIEGHDYQFFFTKGSILEMNFLTFAACVALPYEGLLLAIAVCFGDMNKKKRLFSPTDFTEVINGMCADPGKAYETARKILRDAKVIEVIDVLQNLSCAEVVAGFSDYKKCADEILGMATPKSFNDLLMGVIEYKLFDVYEKGGYLFFGLIDSIEDFLENTLEKVRIKGDDPTDEYISQEERWQLFQTLCDLSQNDFVPKAHEIFKTLPGDTIRNVYNKRLQNFT